MADKEMIKAIECCLKSPVDCDNCAYTKYPVRDCNTILINDIADLINRQQAEIDKLKSDVFGMEFETAMYKAISESARTEAIKEFINELMLLMPEHMMRSNPQPEEWRIKRWINFALDKLYPELLKSGSFFEKCGGSLSNDPRLQKKW